MFDCLLPCLPKRGHQTREEQWAAERTRDAIRSLAAAKVTWKEDCRLRAARLALVVPSARSAARALIAIGIVAKSCDKAAENNVKAAERAVRDVVVLRCLPQVEPWDRLPFIANAAQAFCKPLHLESTELCSEDRELKALLQLAYHTLNGRRDHRR